MNVTWISVRLDPGSKLYHLFYYFSYRNAFFLLNKMKQYFYKNKYIVTFITICYLQYIYPLFLLYHVSNLIYILVEYHMFHPIFCVCFYSEAQCRNIPRFKMYAIVEFTSLCSILTAESLQG